MLISFILKEEIRDDDEFEQDGEDLYFCQCPISLDASGRVVLDGPESYVDAVGFHLPEVLRPFLEAVLITDQEIVPTRRLTQGLYQLEYEGVTVACEIVRRPLAVPLGLAESYGTAQYDIAIRSPDLPHALEAYSVLLQGRITPTKSWEGAS